MLTIFWKLDLKMIYCKMDCWTEIPETFDLKNEISSNQNTPFKVTTQVLHSRLPFNIKFHSSTVVEQFNVNAPPTPL